MSTTRRPPRRDQAAAKALFIALARTDGRWAMLMGFLRLLGMVGR